MNLADIHTEPFLSRLQSERSMQFWVFQALGWGGLCVVTFLSLTVWYGTPNWSHVSHTIVQALLGIGLSTILRYLYKTIWPKAIVTQFVIVLVSVIISSALWTAMRMQAFLWLGQEYDIWKDFGGWYFGSFMVFLSWSAFYYGVKFYQLLQVEREERLQEQLKRLSAEAGAREAQIKMLRYQVNPHFLFNTLNSISALVKTNRADQARTMITQLSHFMRKSLEDEAQAKVTLAEEIQTLRLYVDIEKVRYQDRLQTTFDIDEDCLDIRVPALILQPLFENAMQYAVAGQVGGGHIALTGLREGDTLVLRIGDSGRVGVPALSADALKKGVGLTNIESRLVAHYGAASSVTYGVSDLGGIEVTLRIPVLLTPAEVAGSGVTAFEATPI